MLTTISASNFAATSATRSEPDAWSLAVMTALAPKARQRSRTCSSSQAIMTSPKLRHCLTRSQTCWIMGLPQMSINTLPGKSRRGPARRDDAPLLSWSLLQRPNQLIRSHRGRAHLANDNTGGVIGDIRGLFLFGSSRKTKGESGYYRVPRADTSKTSCARVGICRGSLPRSRRHMPSFTKRDQKRIDFQITQKDRSRTL